MGVNWVFNGLNRCFGPSIGPFGLIRSPKIRWLVDLLACWLVDLLACRLVGFAGVGAKKKGPYSHEPGTFEFYE